MAKQSKKSPAARTATTPLDPPADDALTQAVQEFLSDFPCRVHAFGSVKGNHKHPLAKGGHATATDDPAEVDRRFSNPKAAGFCVYPGDFVILDLDCRNGKDGIVELEKLAAAAGAEFPETATVATPSGNGSCHLYFNIPDGAVVPSSNGKVASGVDVRGNDGKYWAAGPLSRTPKGEYRWERGPKHMADAPTWLIDAIQSAKGAGKTTKDKPRKDYGDPIDWDEEHAKRLVESVEQGKLIKAYEGSFLEGERDNLTFQLFAEAKNRMIHPDVMLEAIQSSGIDGGLDEDHGAGTVERKMRSAYHDSNAGGYGAKVNAYWLPNHVFKAFVDGKPEARPPADPVEWKASNPDKLPKAFPGDPEILRDPGALAGGQGGYAELLRYFEGVLTGSGERQRRAVRFGEIEGTPSVPWIIDGWLPQDGVAILYGESESFKTYMAIHKLLCVATGRAYANRDGFDGYAVGDPREVVMFAGESYSGIVQRINAAIAGGVFDRKLVEQNLVLVRDVYSVNHAHGLAGMADEIEALDARPAIVAIDTLNLALDGNEDSAEDIKRALRGLRALVSRYDAAGLFIDHVGHGAKARPRGSSAKKANADVMILCERDGNTRNVTITQTKNRDADKEGYRAAFCGATVKLDTSATNLHFRAIEPPANTNKPNPAEEIFERDNQARYILAALRSFLGHTWKLRELATEARRKGCTIPYETLRKSVLTTQKGKRGWALDHAALTPYRDPHSESWVTPSELGPIEPRWELKDGDYQ